jgi:hypothetical protein
MHDVRKQDYGRYLGSIENTLFISPKALHVWERCKVGKGKSETITRKKKERKNGSYLTLKTYGGKTTNPVAPIIASQGIKSTI